MPQENVKWLELIPLLKSRAIRAAHGQVIRIIRPAIRNKIRQGNKTDKFLRVEAATKPNGAEYSAHFLLVSGQHCLQENFILASIRCRSVRKFGLQTH